MSLSEYNNNADRVVTVDTNQLILFYLIFHREVIITAALHWDFMYALIRECQLVVADLTRSVSVRAKAGHKQTATWLASE